MGNGGLSILLLVYHGGWSGDVVPWVKGIASHGMLSCFAISVVVICAVAYSRQ